MISPEHLHLVLHLHKVKAKMIKKNIKDKVRPVYPYTTFQKQDNSVLIKDKISTAEAKISCP